LNEKQIVLVATSLLTTTRMSNQSQPVLDGNPRTIDGRLLQGGTAIPVEGQDMCET